MSVGDIPHFQSSSELNAKVSLWKGDITKLEVDAIVNSIHGDESVLDFDYITLTPEPRTVADCIYKAGGKAILEELCESKEWGKDEPVVTRGHRLPAKCMITISDYVCFVDPRYIG